MGSKPDSDRPIVVNCPVCRRVMWADGTCTHGQIPTEMTGNNADARDAKGDLLGGTEKRTRRDKGRG